MTFRLVSAEELAAALHGATAPLVLDARRREALNRKPVGIPSAVPVLLDDPPLRIPRVERRHPIVVYCLCSGQASSTRVALKLLDAGFENVSVLEGGLPQWEARSLPLAPVVSSAGAPSFIVIEPREAQAVEDTATRLIAERTFLAGAALPLRRNMAVLFVDMVDSTQLVFARSPEEVLRLVQAFMQEVVDIAVTHCGDIHDFEGDGAMLYFAGVGESLPAAFDLQEALARRRRKIGDLPQARISLDTGPLVVGYVGTEVRRSLSFIGPSINTAARILRLATPGGIVATERVIVEGQGTNPDLAAGFAALPDKQSLKGVADPVAVFRWQH